MTESNKTPFEAWCEENNYDPEGVFTVAVFDSDGGFAVGTPIKLRDDDGSCCPAFLSTDGTLADDGDPWDYLYLEDLTQTQKATEQSTFPTPPFKLSCGDNPAVQQWLEDNRCVRWLDYPYETYILVDGRKQVSNFTDKEAYEAYSEPEVTPIISPAFVSGFSIEPVEQEPEENSAQESSDVESLQEQITELRSMVVDLVGQINKMSNK